MLLGLLTQNLIKWLGHQHDNLIVNKLAKVKDESLKFNTEVFGNIIYRKRKLEARIKGIQRRLEVIDSSFLIKLEQDLQKEYNIVLYQEELLWHKKSREN